MGDKTQNTKQIFKHTAHAHLCSMLDAVGVIDGCAGGCARDSDLGGNITNFNAIQHSKY